MPERTSAAGTPGEELAETLTAALDGRLAAADAALVRQFPGDAPDRQPVHTVYVPADRFTDGLAADWGRAALAAIDEHPTTFAGLTGDPALVELVRDKLGARADRGRAHRLRGRLRRPWRRCGGRRRTPHGRCVGGDGRLREPSRRSGGSGSRAWRRRPGGAGSGPSPCSCPRCSSAGGDLDGFVVTLPKITSVDQVEAMVELTGRLEDALGLEVRSLRFELQIETPQSILGPDGTALVARMIHAGDGRVTALHYGTYDYSAFCGIPAAYQSMEHPVADHAKLVMQAAAAGTGVRLSDGSTNVLPVGDADCGASRLGAACPAGAPLARARLLPGLGPASRAAADPVRGDLRLLPRRVSTRPPGGCATTSSRPTPSVMDEPATARALSDFIVRGIDCGAVSAAEVRGRHGAGRRHARPPWRGLDVCEPGHPRAVDGAVRQSYVFRHHGK